MYHYHYNHNRDTSLLTDGFNIPSTNDEDFSWLFGPSESSTKWSSNTIGLTSDDMWSTRQPNTNATHKQFATTSTILDTSGFCGGDTNIDHVIPSLTESMSCSRSVSIGSDDSDLLHGFLEPTLWHVNVHDKSLEKYGYQHQPAFNNLPFDDPSNFPMIDNECKFQNRQSESEACTHEVDEFQRFINQSFTEGMPAHEDRWLSSSKDLDEENERFFLQTFFGESSSTRIWTDNREIELAFRNPHAIDEFHIKAGEYEFMIGDVIGSGAFGRVYALDALNSKLNLAMKIVKLDEADAALSLREFELLELMRKNDGMKKHIGLLFFGFLSENNICLVMEKYDMSLSAYLDNSYRSAPMPLGPIKRLAKQLLNALAFMHSLGFAHTDIKPDNIMIVEEPLALMNIKLIDFGCAVTISELARATGCTYQTMPYRCPEVLLGSTLNEKMDLWSVAVLLAEVYTGSMIFPGRTDFEMIKMIYDTFPIPFSFLVDCLRYTYYFELGDDVLRNDISKLKKVCDIPSEEFTSDNLLNTASFAGSVSSFDDINKIGYNSIHFNLITYEDNTFMDFLTCIRKIDPNDRFAAQDALSHAWFLPG